MYVGTRDHKVYALDVNTGRPLWITDVGPGWTALGMVQGISLAGDTVYVGVTHWLAPNGYQQSGVIVALDRINGRVLWRYESAGNQNGIVATPVVAGSNLIADDVIFGTVFAVDRYTGKEVWRISSAPGRYGPQDSPIVSGDTAFIASNDQFLYALNVNSGKPYWVSGGNSGSFTAGAVCGRYVMANAQGLTIFDRNGGRKLSSLLSSVGPQDAFPTSHFATDGKRAYITGILWAWAIDC
jgi:outer membrane protein assembly factor BamB